jgi:hypothetical protein
MASEIEKLLTEQETTSFQLELFNQSKDTFSGILQEGIQENNLISSLISSNQANFKELASSFSSLSVPEPLASNIVEVDNIDQLSPEIIQQAAEPTASETAVPAELNEGNELAETGNLTLRSIDANIQTLADIALDQAKVVGSAGGGADGEELPEPDTGGLSDLFGGITGKFGKLGKLAGRALGVGAAVAGAGIFLSDLYEGFTDDETIKAITGKAKEDLTDAESSSAAIANAISGLSFGLLDAKDVFAEITPYVDMLQNGMDQLFDPEIGIFGTTVSGIFSAVDKFSEGDIMGGLSDLTDAFLEIPKKIFELLGNLASELLEFLPGQMKDAILGGVENITNFAGDAKEKAGEAFDSAKETAASAAKSVSSFFGFGDDEEEAPVAQESTSTGGLEFRDNAQGGAVAQNANRPISAPLAGNSVSGPSAVATSGTGNQGERAVSLSKQRFEESQTSGNGGKGGDTIVVNQQASEGKKVTRETANPDMRLAFLNSGMADG